MRPLPPTISVALYYDLPVYQHVYRQILKLFEITEEFPREYKYTLAQYLKRDGVVLVHSISAYCTESLTIHSLPAKSETVNPS